jgi:hypothetical protein
MSDLIETKRDLAVAFEVSLETVHRWALKGDFPGGRAGPWNKSDVHTWLYNRDSRVLRRAAPAHEDTSGHLIDQAVKSWELLTAEGDKLAGAFPGKPDVQREVLTSVMFDYLCRIFDALGQCEPGTIRDAAVERLGIRERFERDMTVRQCADGKLNSKKRPRVARNQEDQ